MQTNFARPSPARTERFFRGVTLDVLATEMRRLGSTVNVPMLSRFEHGLYKLSLEDEARRRKVLEGMDS